jgi:predicted kinase
MPKPILKIVQGFMGAGKTTYSKWLASQTGELRLNADEYCETNFSKEDLEENWDSCFSQAISNLYVEAENQLRAGNNVILDFGFWNRKSRDFARDLAHRTGADFQHLYLDTPDDMLLDRIKMRSGVIADRNFQNFYKLKDLFEEPMADECAVRISPRQIPNQSYDLE